MEDTELIRSLNKEMAVDMPEKISYDELGTLLANHINDLIKNDFEKLVRYLYRIDVDEQKLRSLLSKHAGENAGNIIALLIIERQQQKIKTREHPDNHQDSQRDNDVEGEEKW